MRKLACLGITLVLLLPVWTAAAGSPERGYIATLKALAERPAEPFDPKRHTNADVLPGSLIFSMSYLDNAACVRSIPDVTGDGKDEIIVGFDVSQVPNVFCLSGASTGTATTVWSFQPTDGASGGSPYGDQSVVPASDSDGNDAANILVGTAWGGRTAYNLDGATGAVIWKLDTYNESESGWIYSLAELDDNNGDGVKECAFGAGSKNDTLYGVDGASTGTATVRWRFAGGDAVMSVRNIGDVSGDGHDDVLAGVTDYGQKVICVNGVSAAAPGGLLWQYPTGHTVAKVGVLPDINDDGKNEALAAIWTSDGTGIRCIDGSRGVQLWASSTVNSGQAVEPLQDVNGDGITDVIVGSNHNAVIVLSGADGSQIWSEPVGSLNGGYVWSVHAIGDVTGDGHEDVIAGSFDYYVYLMDGVTGAKKWAYLTNNRVFSVYPTGDLNGDGTPDVVAGCQDTNNSTVVYVLEGDGQIPVELMSFSVE